MTRIIKKRRVAKLTVLKVLHIQQDVLEMKELNRVVCLQVNMKILHLYKTFIRIKILFKINYIPVQQ